MDPNNSDDGQDENKDEAIDICLIKDTTEGIEVNDHDNIVDYNDYNGVLKVPEVVTEDVIEVSNGDGIENETVVELVEDQLL